MLDFDARVREATGGVLAARELAVLQLNVGLRCNLVCRHCHLGCSPTRSEQMERGVMERVVALAGELRPELIDRITTRVISNRYPAYSVRGGVYDALRATGGRMYGIVNDEVYDSMKMFEEHEGIDIVPAAGVAVAALRQAVRDEHFRKDELVLLNITGGGEERLRKDHEIHRVRPVFISKQATDDELEEMLCGMLKRD